MIKRPFFTEEHDVFRASVRRFVEREIVPHHAEWERAGRVPREVWLKAGPSFNTPKEFRDQIQSELAQNAAVVKRANIQAE